VRKLVALDLDGTLTQHKSKMESVCRETLWKISQQYTIVMVCAGGCERVYCQMDEYPVDIIGFYGMEYSTVQDGELLVAYKEVVDNDKHEISHRIDGLRN